jgi:hypothetical protein
MTRQKSTHLQLFVFLLQSQKRLLCQVVGVLLGGQTDGGSSSCIHATWGTVALAWTDGSAFLRVGVGVCDLSLAALHDAETESATR